MFKKKTNLQIQYDQSGKDILANSVNECIGFLNEAKQELKNNKVEIESLEQLSQSDFVELLNQSLQGKYENSNVADELELSFDEFKELKKVDTSKLEELQARYDQKKNQIESLYDYNTSFFQFCESQPSGDFECKAALKKAPKKQDYRIGDMFSIVGNKVKIDIPEKPFEMYLLNNKQKELIVSIQKFIEASKELDFELKFIWDAVRIYLSKDCDYDLKDVVFNYNEILKQKL